MKQKISIDKYIKIDKEKIKIPTKPDKGWMPPDEPADIGRKGWMPPSEGRIRKKIPSDWIKVPGNIKP